jgi:hypothetical protein
VDFSQREFTRCGLIPPYLSAIGTPDDLFIEWRIIKEQKDQNGHEVAELGRVQIVCTCVEAGELSGSAFADRSSPVKR